MLHRLNTLNTKGFSLVELSIVLVILGLLVGGVLSGQSLIRAAELRSVSAEYSRYLAATQSFRDKYFAIPGDMSNATQFWARLNTNADCVSNSGLAVAGSPGACDGNGDGKLTVSSGASKSAEKSQFWRQLAFAGLVEGTYSGLSGSGGADHCVIGTDCPKAKLSNAGWSVSNKTSAGNSNEYALDYGNYFAFGSSTTTSITLGAVIKPEEAWNIDTKLDDGKPAYGKVIAQYWNTACATGGASSSDLANSVYYLTSTSTACALYFAQQF